MKIYNEKIACTADLHLGNHQDSPIWHNICLNLANWIKQKLTEQNIKDLIILGDIYNNRNEISVPTLNTVPKFFEILKDFNIILLVGNHDCYYNKRSDVHSIGSLAGWNNITVLDKMTTITAHDRVITFCPWETKLEDIPKSDIIFGHFEIQSFKITNKKVCDFGFKTQDLLEKGKLIVSGHFHLTESRTYKQGEILYVGSPYELNWNDYLSKKGIYTLDIPSKKYEFIENKVSPKHFKIRLSEIIALGKISDDIKKEFKGNIVSFIVDQEVPSATIEKLLEKLLLLQPLDLKPEYVIQWKDVDINEPLTSFSGVDVRASLIEYINAMENVEQKEDVIKYILEVLTKVEKEI